MGAAMIAGGFTAFLFGGMCARDQRRLYHRDLGSPAFWENVMAIGFLVATAGVPLAIWGAW
jgi:hypothetical protein